MRHQERETRAPWETSLPSTTQVLGRYVDLQNIPPARLQFACARGTKIHDLIETDLRGGWVLPDLITPEVEQYWKSYLIFKNEMIAETLYVEKELVCDVYGFVGHIDWIGRLRGEDGIAVIDWKSPISEGKTWRSQLAAYWHLVENHAGLTIPVKRCGALMLSPKGRAPILKEYTEFKAEYFNDFILALGAYNAFKE